MLFNAPEFLVFLPLVLGIYYVLRTRPQNIWLLGASYFFYGWWDWRFTSLLLVSTVLDFNCALEMVRRPHKKRLFLLASLCGNLGILGTFKYFNFFADSAVRLLNQLGLNPDLLTLKVILPVGISFYTFQSLAYTIDVYRGKLRPTTRFVDFALYVSYFPQLVAGPIERATNLLPQLERKRVVDEKLVTSGLLLILLGYVKKVGIADAVGPLVDRAFADPTQYSSYGLLVALYLFSIQIYCDFSGYSDIARGVSRLFGIRIMRNFNQPYLSASISEFWRRWHISLSTWLRDYLYIPLGGNRRGPRRAYANLMITMLLGGLWHGASWTFVIWGALHGVYLSVHKRILAGRKPVVEHSLESARDYLVFAAKCVLTFHLVSLSWIFFRSPNFSAAFAYLTRILLWNGVGQSIAGVVVVFYGLLLLLIDLPQYRARSHTRILQWHWTWRATVYVVFGLVILIGGFGQRAPFIYFQF